jgi:hypothetical protein
MERNDSCDGCKGCELSKKFGGKKPTDFNDLEEFKNPNGTWRESLIIEGMIIQIKTNGCQNYNKI